MFQFSMNGLKIDKLVTNHLTLRCHGCVFTTDLDLHIMCTEIHKSHNVVSEQQLCTVLNGAFIRHITLICEKYFPNLMLSVKVPGAIPTQDLILEHTKGNVFNSTQTWG